MDERYRPVPTYYSESFKLQVVEEVLSGQISQTGAQKKYGIGGNTTISRWIKKFSNFAEEQPTRRNEMSKEKEEIARLKKDKEDLERALGKAHLEILRLETTVDVYSKEVEKQRKKKPVMKSLPGVYIDPEKKD
jgi:transposase-like protein